MDARHFDALTQSLRAGTSRRLLVALTALPLMGGLLAVLDPDEAAANGTTLHGNGSLTLWPVVLVSGASTVFLRDLRVTGGNNDVAPGGIELEASAALTLTGVLVTGNHAYRAGGILNDERSPWARARR